MKILKAIERISPKLVGKMAYHSYMHPNVRKFRSFEKDIHEKATKSFFDFRGKKIAKYTWGNGDKKALLIHGWEGRASNLGKAVPILVEKGYQVIAFDGPSHGDSDKMKNPFKMFSDVIEHLLKTEEFEVLITHSTGSTFALWCLHQLKQSVPQIFIFTTHNVLADTFQLGVDKFGLSKKTLQVMLEIFEKNVGFSPKDIVTQKFAKTIDFEKIIFVADEDDKVLPYQWTQRVQQVIPNSEMILFKGTGHFRMLWSEAFDNLLKAEVN